MEAAFEDDAVAVEDGALKTKLKPYPGRGMGVNENASLCMLKMAVPICTVETNPDSPKYTGEDNCQSGKYRTGWWLECEAKGHKPYFYVKETPVTEKITDESGYVTGTREKINTQTILNVVQVSISPRHNSGHEVADYKTRGAKTLNELGYENVCMMRNCEDPVKVQTKYGEFCNERHARLVIAELKKIFLVTGGDDSSGWQEIREQQLNDISLT